MGEGGGTQRARVQALRIANSPPELSARARATSRPRSPTRNRGAAGARAGWARGGGGLGLPSAGNHTGRGEGGGRRPLRDVDRQVSRAARAPRPLRSARSIRPGPAPATSSAPSGRRCGRLSAAPGRSGCVRNARGCVRTGFWKPAAPGPCKGPPSLSSRPGALAVLPAPARTPLPSGSAAPGTAHLGRPRVGPRALGPPARAPTSASPPSFPRLRVEPVQPRSASVELQPRPRPRRSPGSLKPVCGHAEPVGVGVDGFPPPTPALPQVQLTYLVQS